MNDKDSNKILSKQQLHNLPPDELVLMVLRLQGKLQHQDVLISDKKIKFIKREVEQINSVRTKIEYIRDDGSKKYKQKTIKKKRNPAMYKLYQYNNITLICYPFDHEDKLYMNITGGLTTIDNYNDNRLMAIMNKAKYFLSGEWKKRKENESSDAKGLRKAYKYSFDKMVEINNKIKVEEHNKYVPSDKQITVTKNKDGSFRKKRSDAGKPRKKKI